LNLFPADFLWGASTSAYQVEGGIDMDGRSPSIWDAFCAQPGRVRNGDTGAIAVDHRHRAAEDVDLMAALGLQAYRFSIAWPRVQPNGNGPASSSGLDFYSRLVDELLAHDIEPVVTLYHWDLPLALEEAGGWPMRDTALRFAEYAQLVASALGDRVHMWSTINEPWCASMLGYAAGVHAPGRVEPGAAVAAAHHLLLAHGLAVDTLRDTIHDPTLEVGISLNPYPVVALSANEQDVDAARRVDGVANRLWYDAVMRGSYPADVLDDFRTVSSLDHVQPGDLEQISRPIDYLGINYYRRHHARREQGASRNGTWPGSPDVGMVEPEVPHTTGGWAVEPEGLTETLLRVKQDYGDIPLYVHENGAAFSDEVVENTIVRDHDRVEFIEQHVLATHAAINAGVDVRGYFVWSLFDNFEWAEGYTRRFGIVHVDYESLVRTPKLSARRYSTIVNTNSV
jgi:beta-glucosidase